MAFLYIGNLPYSVKEDFVTAFVETKCGCRVKSARIMIDDKGDSRGFCFVEVPDIITARKAVDMLLGQEISGRKIRVALKDSGMGEVSAPESTSASDAALDKIPVGELWELLNHMKSMVEENPDKVRKVLYENPKFAQLVLQAQVRFGMIKPVEEPEPVKSEEAMDVVEPAPVKTEAAILETAKLNPQQQALLKQVMTMTPAQIEALPPVQREGVKKLLQRVRG